VKIHKLGSGEIHADSVLLYPGHGAPGTVGPLDAQYDYLLANRTELANGSSTVDDLAAAEPVRQAR
jgi:hypothetical protein